MFRYLVKCYFCCIIYIIYIYKQTPHVTDSSLWLACFLPSGSLYTADCYECAILYLFQNSLSPTHRHMLNSNVYTHTPCGIDRLPEDTRSSRMVSIFKAVLSSGDLFHNLINMGSALLKYSSGTEKGRLEE